MTDLLPVIPRASAGCIHRWFKQLIHIARSAIFFASCKGCGNRLVFADEDLICRDCGQEIADIRYHDGLLNFCQLCGRTLDHGYDRCGQCILIPPPYTIHRSFSRYRELLRNLILIYKYNEIESLKRLFAGYFFRLFADWAHENFDYIIPVPPDRGRKREFSPILEIAKILSRRLNIPLCSRTLVKVKHTLPQAGLSRTQRLTNLDGAFDLRSPENIAGKKLLLIDDVYTTGTTINKCARLLTGQKADVTALTLARS